MTSFFNCNHDWKEKEAHDLKGPKRYIFAKNGPFWPKILHNVYQIFESPASILCIMEISFMFYLFLFFFQWMHIIQVQHSLYTKASRRRIANQKNKKQKKIKKIKKITCHTPQIKLIWLFSRWGWEIVQVQISVIFISFRFEAEFIPGNLWRLLMQQGIRNYLGLEVRFDVPCKQFCIHFIPRSHSEPPLVFQLPTEVQVHVWYQQAILVTGERRCARCIWCWKMAGSIEMPKICMLRLPIARSEWIGEDLSPNAIDWRNKVTICYCSIACLKQTSFIIINWMQQVLIEKITILQTSKLINMRNKPL